ncbi:MAG: pilus assembly protein PilP [Deltaproteobacteria bacterium]|jgi:type IV pilus assembly protein PilP|nr:pilus assembly protein PilP [Deltaproteobacteria bacterium]
MKKNLIILCNLACLIGFFTGLLGCDQPANEPATPKIVRKKIRSTADKMSAPPPRQPASASQPDAKPEAPGPGIQASEKPVLAQKSAPSAVKPPESKVPQLPLKPKSDISKIQPSSSGQPAEPGADQTTIASTSINERPTYSVKGKVNPFEPLFRERQMVASKSKRKKRVPRTPLEKIDLSQLKLVGIVTASSGNQALVEESNGKGYVIRKGTYIGTNAGKVVEIENDKVIVAEEYEDVVGNVTLRNKELTLPKPPGEF